MKRQKVITILFSALCVPIAGCDSFGTNDSLKLSTVNDITSYPDLPKLENGRLTFQASADFNTLFDHLIENQDPSDLEEFEANIKGFVSLRTITNRLLYEMADDGKEDEVGESPLDNQEIVRIVEDPILELLLNQDGEIQISDSVYKVTRDYVYGVTAENAEILSRIQLWSSRPSKMHTGGDIKIVKVDRSIASEVVSKSNSISDIQGRGECWVSMPEGPRRRYRLKGSSWINNWGFTRTFGSELEVQQIKKRGFRRWYHHRVAEINMSGTFSKKVDNEFDVQITVHASIDLTKYNAAEIRRTHERDRGKDDILGANIDMTFYALKTQDPADEVTCSKTRSWNW
ncbi:MAG: hypothetical protein F4100_11515 [Rhodothermaceae bacterium]|nr:hypothetical protein [Rhodothermaceae bacterium]MYE62576.1 hypothetical protein [Rhodothermaceae bacterium]MYJ21346.1 hypothetical protein [Rhodothermaceae bacterium]